MPLTEVTAHQLLDAAPDAFITVDSRGRITYVNAAAARMFGYEASELEGERLDILLPREVRDAHAEQVGDFFRDRGQLHADRPGIQARHKDGTVFPVEVGVATVSEAGREGVAVACIRDVRERRAMEQEKREQAALHEAIFSEAPIGIAITATDGRFVEVNDALADMLGYSPGELVGLHFADVTHPDDVAANLELYEELLAGRIDSYAVEKRYVCKDGAIIRANLRVAGLGEQVEGARRYAVGMIEDVTEQRSLQEQLLLSQRLEAVGQLAGGIAHDFNNYLTAISGYSQLAMLALPDGHAARPDLLEVLKAAESSANLTRQILAFSRRQVLDRRVLDLNGLLRDVRKMLGRLLGEDVEIEMDLDAELWPLSADPAQLEQVLMNLAVNARDAMPRGGRLLVRTTNAQVDELVASQRPGVAPGEYVLLTVADTGVGMSAETRDRAFEPFFTTKKRGEGTGLGLSTVYGIVKQHGGNIWVASEEGAGTTFRLYLPRATGDETAATRQGVAVTAPPEGSGHVLVVEDDEHVRDLVIRSLESCGYEVISAPGAVEALELMEGEGPDIDLLLTDVVMPRMSGLELADRLRSLRPGLKTLLMSGHSAEALARYQPESTIGERKIRWLHKPFTLERLARAVEQALEDEED